MPIGDHLRDVMDLYGSPKCPHTNAVLIAAGEKGVERALNLIRDEIIRDMKLMGCTSIDQLNRSNLHYS